MKETKENKKIKKGKHREKPTIGDIIFRVLILIAIFFIAIIAYTFYIKGISYQTSSNGYITQNSVKPIDKAN